MSYIVDLETFHGPLDLLLYLIEKNQVDIYDIPVAEITEQYINYLNYSNEINLEQLGDFLVLASYLLNLKSKMLLPKHSHEQEEEEFYESDPRDELVEKLLEYRKFKEAAKFLASIQQGEENRVFFRRISFSQETNEVLVADVKSLVKAYKEVIQRLKKNSYEFDVPVGDINVAHKMDEILDQLFSKPRALVFQEVFTQTKSKREALAFFLALLELIRLQKVIAIQDKTDNTITITLRVNYI